MFTRAWARSFVERVAATWIEATLAVLAATQWADLDLPGLVAVAWATVPAGLTAAKEFLALTLDRPTAPGSWLRDMIERTGATWAVGFLTLVAAGWADKIDLDLVQSAAWAAAPAALAVVKAAVASRVGDPRTAALLPKAA